jgi:hypothetical protein
MPARAASTPSLPWGLAACTSTALRLAFLVAVAVYLAFLGRRILGLSVSEWVDDEAGAASAVHLPPGVRTPATHGARGLPATGSPSPLPSLPPPSPPPSPSLSPAGTPQPTPSPTPSPPPRVFLFTMDSITSYVANAASGGPAGEILVRESLEWGLRALGAVVEVAHSDDQFADMTRDEEAVGRYSAFVFDPWTFVAPGWKPRHFLPGREDRTFLLSFFGLREAGHGLRLPLAHILTPYPLNNGNAFLGFAMQPRWRARAEAHFDGKHLRTHTVDPGAHQGEAVGEYARHGERRRGAAVTPPPLQPPKRRQGVVWGKKAEYFDDQLHVVKAVAAVAELHTTANLGVTIEGLVTHGHLTRQEWAALLAESAFMIGLGENCSCGGRGGHLEGGATPPQHACPAVCGCGGPATTWAPTPPGWCDWNPPPLPQPSQATRWRAPRRWTRWQRARCSSTPHTPPPGWGTLHRSTPSCSRPWGRRTCATTRSRTPPQRWRAWRRCCSAWAPWRRTSRRR